MCRFVFLLGIGLAAGELVLMLRAAESIGGLETFSLIILTAAVGLRYARFETASLPMRLQKQQVGTTQAALEAALLSLGAFALLVPGFITDAFGILCLIPPTRTLIAYFIYRRIQNQMQHIPANEIFARTSGHPFSDYKSGSDSDPVSGRRDNNNGDIIVVQKKQKSDGKESDT